MFIQIFLLQEEKNALKLYSSASWKIIFQKRHCTIILLIEEFCTTTYIATQNRILVSAIVQITISLHVLCSKQYMVHYQVYLQEYTYYIIQYLCNLKVGVKNCLQHAGTRIRVQISRKIYIVLVCIIVCGNFYLEQLKAKAFVKQVDVKGVMR